MIDDNSQTKEPKTNSHRGKNWNFFARGHFLLVQRPEIIERSIEKDKEETLQLGCSPDTIDLHQV